MNETSTAVEIRLTDFVDFVLLSAVAQQRKVREIKGRNAYDPVNDHYKQMREGIVRMHKYNDPVEKLGDICNRVVDKKKATYKAVATGYEKFLHNKIAIWFQPMRKLWEHKPSGLGIWVNPEVGLRINGTPHLLKLYFNKTPLQRDRVLGVVQLMENSLRPYHTTDTVFGLLDAPNNKLWTTADCKEDLMPSIRAHAMAFMQMYNEL